jgi:predicted heme/steroid binding protein
MREFTEEQLKKYDGKDGRKAFIAYGGKVYDVTDSFLWKKGKHQAVHSAGKDLTDKLEEAPHGIEFLEKFPVIGRLKR